MNDRTKQLKAFDDTKTGVKGLIDAAAGGVVDIPDIFTRPPDEVAEDLELGRTSLQVPAIDLHGVDDKGSLRRDHIIKEIKQASEKWGFFQVVNHGIPIKVLEDMLKAVLEFNEQEVEVKKNYYSRDPERMVKFNTNYDLYMSSAATWRDTLIVDMLNNYRLDPQDLPLVCREATVDYLNHVMKFVDTLFELLSEALGLEPNHLKLLECEKGKTLTCHYYPACPKPEQTLGLNKHTDASFITLLLQDEIGGLQVLHQNQWANVNPIPNALVVNIGDLLQYMPHTRSKGPPPKHTADSALSSVTSGESSTKVVNSVWHVDSGCSRHMMGLKDLFTNYQIINRGYVTFVGDKKEGKMIGQGEVSNGSLTLDKVNYVPELAFNLLSVSQICDKSIPVLFKSNECLFLKS